MTFGMSALAFIVLIVLLLILWTDNITAFNATDADLRAEEVISSLIDEVESEYQSKDEFSKDALKRTRMVSMIGESYSTN